MDNKCGVAGILIYCEALALINKPLTVKCTTCEGEGNYDDAPDGSCSEHIVSCPHCDKGQSDIIWKQPYECDNPLITAKYKPLTLHDLQDHDVAWTYSNICNLKLRGVSSLATIPNNKGTLEVKHGH